MRKVLMLMPTNSSFTKPIKEAFTKLGFQVKVYDYRRGDLPVRIHRFLPFYGGRKLADEYKEKRIGQLCSDFMPDLIFVNKGELLNEELIRKIKRKKNILINLFPEYLNYWKLAKNLSQFYDYFLVFDYPLRNRLKKIGRKNVCYLPFGVQIEKYTSNKKIYDVSFVGTWRKSRENTLSKLKEFNLNIWGDSRWLKSSLKEFVRGGRISQDKMMDIVKKSKIHLNIYFSGFKLDGAALRVFETTSCGTFLLSEYKKSIAELFVDKKEVVLAKSINELKKYISYYLEHEQDREKIAFLGRQRVKLDHTWEQRLFALFSKIGKFKTLSKGREVQFIS